MDPLSPCNSARLQLPYLRGFTSAYDVVIWYVRVCVYIYNVKNYCLVQLPYLWLNLLFSVLYKTRASDQYDNMTFSSLYVKRWNGFGTDASLWLWRREWEISSRNIATKMLQNPVIFVWKPEFCIWIATGKCLRLSVWEKSRSRQGEKDQCLPASLNFHGALARRRWVLQPKATVASEVIFGSGWVCNSLRNACWIQMMKLGCEVKMNAAGVPACACCIAASARLRRSLSGWVQVWAEEWTNVKIGLVKMNINSGELSYQGSHKLWDGTRGRDAQTRIEVVERRVTAFRTTVGLYLHNVS